MIQVTSLINDAEKREVDLIKNPPPSEADDEAAKAIVKDKGEAVAQVLKAAKKEFTAAVAELNKAEENASALEQRAKLKPGLPKKDGKIDYSQDFFAHQAFLTVSGQLQVETYACAVSCVYTFGPAFRAEHSHTTRHLSEFWMIEPEIAFADLQDTMNCAEAYVKFMSKWLLDKCFDDMEFMAKNYDEACIDRLRMVVSTPFERVTITEAVEILKDAIQVGKKFENEVEWGTDLAFEHERFLTEVQFQKPVIVYNYPKGIKAFYMKLNDDWKTEATMDVLVPKVRSSFTTCFESVAIYVVMLNVIHVGELIGGSQREESCEVLKEKYM